MANSRTSSAARARLPFVAVFALGLASASPAAQAQNAPDRPAAPSPPNAPPAQQPAAEPAPWPGVAPVPPSSVEGVTVSGRRPGPAGNAVPDDKAAAYTAEVAKAKAWQDYRKSMPRATSDPNDLSKDYPGLQTLLPSQ